MFRYERTITFPEVDAARVIFFSRVFEYCHATLEALFESLPGGYAQLTSVRDLGIPTVHLDADYHAPLRYGDVVVVELEVESIGTKSVRLRYRFRRKADAEVCVTISQVVVTARMSAFEGVPVPDDLRALLSHHLTTAAPASRMDTP